MGYGCGFDVLPRLEATPSNIEAYKGFLDELILKYKNVYDEESSRDGGKLLMLPTDPDSTDKVFLYLTVGEWPHIPENPDRCDYFYRFGSKISSSTTACARRYILEVLEIAKKHFGSRIHFWNEQNECGGERQWGIYEWPAIYKVDKDLEDLEATREEELQRRLLEGGVQEMTGDSGGSVDPMETKTSQSRN